MRRATAAVYTGTGRASVSATWDTALSQERSIELAGRSGTEHRSVRLSVRNNGSIRMDAHDMGALVKEMFDRDDYEYAVEVPADAIAELAFALLRERFAGDVSAVDALRAFCAAHAIAHRFDTWP